MLSRAQIINAIESGSIIIDPFDPELLNPNSVNVTLGNWFIRIRSDPNTFEPQYRELLWVNDGEAVLIDNDTTTLAVTKEVIGSNIYIPEMHNRSTTRRRGLTICGDAGYGDLGYVNRWTVELKSELDGPVKMIVGQPFAQFSFTATGIDVSPELYAGQYTSCEWPINMIPRFYRPLYEVAYAQSSRFVAENAAMIKKMAGFFCDPIGAKLL